MFIASTPVRVKASSVGAPCFDRHLMDVAPSTTKHRAAPTELDRGAGAVVSINIALLTELFVSSPVAHLGIKDAYKVQRSRAHSTPNKLAFIRPIREIDPCSWVAITDVPE